MNKELIDQLRLDAGIARLTDWDKGLVCVSKDGTAMDPLDGLGLFAELIVKECIRVVLDHYYTDPPVLDALELIESHFGIKK